MSKKNSKNRFDFWGNLFKKFSKTGASSSENFSKDLILKCDCGNYEYIEITRFEDEFFVCFISEPFDFWYRLRKAIKYIWGKPLYYHEVVLDKEKAMLMASKLFKEVSDYNEKEFINYLKKYI